MRTTAIALAAIIFGLPQTTIAGGCYSQAVKAYVSPYYVQKAQVYYYVGAPIRQAAMLEVEKATDPDYQQFLEFKQFRTEWEAFKAQQTAPPGALPQQAPQTQLQASCIRCHSGPEPKGGHDFSGPLTTDQLKAIKEILPSGKMPPASSPEAKGFSNELAGQVILDAIDQLGEVETLTAPPAEELPPAPPEESP